MEIVNKQDVPNTTGDNGSTTSQAEIVNGQDVPTTPPTTSQVEIVNGQDVPTTPPATSQVEIVNGQDVPTTTTTGDNGSTTSQVEIVNGQDVSTTTTTTGDHGASTTSNAILDGEVYKGNQQVETSNVVEKLRNSMPYTRQSSLLREVYSQQVDNQFLNGINPFPEYGAKNPPSGSNGKEQDGGGNQEEIFQNARSTEFAKWLKFLMIDGADTLRSYLKTLFSSNPTGKIPIKESNIDLVNEGFQFGGVWPFKGEQVVASQSFPEFKKKDIDGFRPLPEITKKKKDFQGSISNILKDDTDLVKYLVYISKKFVNPEHINYVGDVDLNEVYGKDILQNNKNIIQFFGSEENNVKTLLHDIKISNVRQILNGLLKEQNYDTNRITNIVKNNKLDLFDGVVSIRHQSKDEPQQSQASQKPIPEAMIVSPSIQPEQNEVNKIQTNVEPKKEKASMISMLPQLSMPSIFVGNKTSSNLPRIGSITKAALDVIQEMDTFAMQTKRKQAKWIDELRAMVSQGEVSLNTQIQNKVNILSNSKILEIERKKVSVQLLSLFKKYIDACETKANVNFSNFKEFFFTYKRREIKQLLGFIETYAYLITPAFEASLTDPTDRQNLVGLSKTYKDIADSFNVLVAKMHTNNKEFYSSLTDAIEGTVKDSYLIYMRDKERAIILNRLKGVSEAIGRYPDKIKYFYTLSYPVTEMFDTQFIILYVITALRIISFRFSMNMATSIFLQKYESVVYDQKQIPPSLVGYMFIFLAFDVFFNVFLLVTLGLCGFLFKTDNNAFPIDKYLFTKLGFDYVISTTVILLIGMLVGKVVKDKKYFRYKTEGERGIRAFEEIMKSTASIIAALPLFLVVS